MLLKEKIYKILRKSEKYTQTDMVYLAKGGSWLTFGQIISSASVLLLSIAFANLLPRETYGIYRYVLSMASILMIFALPGINTALIQAVARGYKGSVIPGLKTKIHWGLLGGLISLGLSGYYYFNDNITLTLSFLIVAAFLPLIESFSVYMAFLNGQKLFNISTRYGVSVQIISVASLIATLFLTKNLFLILLAYFIPYTLLRFIFFKITLKKFPPNKKEDPQTISYGKHLSLINVINTLANFLDRILVFHFIGAVELAIYSFAIAIPEQIKGVFKNIGSLALPKFSIRTKEEIKSTIFKKILKLLIFAGIITVIYIILAPFIYKILFPQYMDSVFYSQIFSISLISVISILPLSALRSQMAKKQLYQYNIFGSLIQIFLLFLFLYFFGLLGIVIARVITRFTRLAIVFWLIKKI